MKGKRGRKSAAELMTPQPLEAYARQPLPPEIIGEEAEEYVRIVNAYPADWIEPAAVPLLVQFCRHVVQARRVAEVLERVVGQQETQMAFYSDLLKEQRAESASLASLATKLRLTPQSRRNDRGNVQPVARTGRPPWEPRE
jgi:hypothetical protein